MKLKTVWLWGGLARFALTVGALCLFNGFVLAELVGVEAAILIGSLAGIVAGFVCTALWPCWRFEWVDA